MFKKASLFLCCVSILSMSVAGCDTGGTNSSEVTSEPKLITELPQKEVVKDDTKASPSIPKFVFLDDSIISNIRSYCNTKTHVKMEQEMTSYSILKDNQGDSKRVVNVSVEVDLKKKISLSELVVGDDTNRTRYYFADDNKNNIHLSKVSDGKYIQDSDLKSSIDINYKDVTNAFTFMQAVSNGLLPTKGTIGRIEDNKYIFKTVRDANKEDLSGTEYDRLGLTTVTLVLNNDKDGNLIPESLSMDTTYYVGENKFGVSTVCKFSDYTSETLKLPEYVKIKKQSKVSKKK